VAGQRARPAATVRVTLRAVTAQPLELILARNLVSAVELAAFIVDPDGVVVFFNDSAGELIGRRFEEVGRLEREEWTSQFGPFDEFGQLLPTDSLPLTVALREGLPANGRFHVRVRDEDLVEVDVSALPLVTAHGFQGAVVVFWRPGDVGVA
jgi:PAS domain-containing protein